MNEVFYTMAMWTAGIVAVVATIGAIGSSIEVAKVKRRNRRAAAIVERWCEEHPQDVQALQLLEELEKAS